MKPSVKYTAIFQHREKYRVSVMCRFFEVSRSGYYGYVKRIGNPQKDEPLAGMVRECQDRCGKTYGYKRIHVWLIREKSLYLNPKTVLRVMNKYGLLSEIRRRRKYKVMGEQVHKYAISLTATSRQTGPTPSG